MTTIINNKLTDETLSAWKAEAKISMSETAKDAPEYSHHAAIFELVTELQERRKVTAEPVSFDALRDAVAEVSGGPAMEWIDIYKGHQAVPFINFNSLARIVDKFRAAPPAPVVPEEATPKNIEMLASARVNNVTFQWDEDQCNAGADAWNACRAAMLQGSQPVSNRDELPVTEIECDICGFKSTDPDGAHYCCEDNSND